MVNAYLINASTKVWNVLEMVIANFHWTPESSHVLAMITAWVCIVINATLVSDLMAMVVAPPTRALHRKPHTPVQAMAIASRAMMALSSAGVLRRQAISVILVRKVMNR